MRNFTYIFFILLAPSLIHGQTARAFEKAGDEAFQRKDLGTALQYFSEAIAIKPDDLELSYKYAEVARSFFAYDLALEYYKKVSESKSSQNYPLTNYWIAEVHRGQGNYEAAKNAYEKYLQHINNETFKGEAEKRIMECIWAMSVIDNAHNVKIQALNKRVNTPYSEFGPLLRGDTLYYSSLRYDKASDENDPPRKISKVLTSVKGSKGRPLKQRFNTDEQLTAHAAFNAAGNRIFFTICDYEEGLKIRCDLYYRDWNTKRRRWDKATKLTEAINQPGSTTTHPNIFTDPITQQDHLLFVSDRKGGKGGLDIWLAKMNKDGEFADPQNLATLNTEKDEITPFFHEASATLFFSSNGYQGLGGFDIYEADFSEGTYSNVEHIGFPMNSSFNDMYFILDADSTLAYISSNREGAMYLDENNKSCCNDIFRAQISAPEEPANNNPPDSSNIVTVPELPNEIDSLVSPDPLVDIDLPPSTLEDFLPLALYFDNDEPDRRTRRNTTKKSYLQTFDPYYSRRGEFRQTYTQGFKGEEKIQAEASIDEFFAEKVLRGKEYIGLFSDILLSRLQEGEKIEIFIKGFTSPRAKSDYNIHLGKRRISSVKNHFKTHQNGVFLPFITSGKLILSERSFGETAAQQNVNDDLDNQRLSIYSPEASLERRVEIVEIVRSE